LDIGCGYGGLLFELSKICPEELILGLEIRDTITEFVGKKIRALRLSQNDTQNAAVIRTNSQKYLTNYIGKESIKKIFICFPDPNFKSNKHNRRIINLGFLSEYAYVLQKGGILYSITDVEELHQWHLSHLRSHSLFEEIPFDTLKNDPLVSAMINSTEEGKKVEREGRPKFYCVFRKKD
jgi:tRNA (guanine-N7-)-methyltransferase